MDHIYDVIIIGGGPAGCTAALYCARAGLNTLILEKLAPGGQMTQANQIDNYPGFENGIDGYTLGKKMLYNAERFGAVTVLTEVLSVQLTDRIKAIATGEGVFKSRSVIIATGASHRELGIPGEKELLGRGVSYCAACDGMLYRDKTVIVAGGGNTAVMDALQLSRICRKVIVVHRRDTLKAEKYYQDALFNIKNVEIYWNSIITELLRNSKITGAILQNVQTRAETTLLCDGIFVSIGRTPVTELFAGQIELDSVGYIVADESTRTTLPGVCAVGDVRTKAMRQIVTAVADGAVASHYVAEYLSKMVAAV